VHASTLWLAIGAVLLVLIWRAVHATRKAARMRQEREAAAALALATAQADGERKAAEKKATRAAAKVEAERVIAAEAARVRALRSARNEEAERVAREAARRAVLEAGEESAGLAARQALEQAARQSQGLAPAEARPDDAPASAPAPVVEPAAAPITAAATEARAAPSDDADSRPEAAPLERSEAAAPTAAAPAAPKPPAETLILVADDSKVVRLKAGRLLTQHGYRVMYAVDGADALKQVEAEMPDLVVSDIEMPNMDGFGLFRHLRGTARTAHVPVIMISSADAMHRESAMREGVSLVLGKPFPEEPLLEHIRSFRFPLAASAVEPGVNRRDWSQTEAGALA
jgi:CheY-like chemotaxis protein